MISRIEILVEEQSIKEFLSIALPKVINKPWEINQNYFIRSFDGKNDLRKNIPTKVKSFSSFNELNFGVVILHDQDSSDCKKLKQDLINLCESNGRCEKLVRIVCKELEAWYLGDFEAIGKAYPTINYSKYQNKAKFRNPDLCNAYDELKKIVPDFQKVTGAKKIAHHISIEKNRSKSFQNTISGLKGFFEKLTPTKYS